MKSVLRKVLVSLAIVVGTCIWLAGAGTCKYPSQGMRLYVFSSLASTGLQTGATGRLQSRLPSS